MSLLSEDREPVRLFPVAAPDDTDLFSFSGSVGPNGENRREDVIKAQTLLARTGDFQSPFDMPTGWPSSDLFKGITTFQKRHGKQPDGTLLPVPPGGVDQNGVGESLVALRGDVGPDFAGRTAPTPSEVDAHYDEQTRFSDTADTASAFKLTPSTEAQARPAPVPQTKPALPGKRQAEQTTEAGPDSSVASSLSDRGLELLKQFEEFRERRYPDQAGHPTIGFGHRIYQHEENRFGETIDKPAAGKLLAEDAAAAQRAVRRSVKIELNQAQFDALTSFAYNIGPNGFAKSDVVKKLNEGDVQGAADELLSYNKVTVRGEKVPSKGLTARRQEERKLFLHGYE